MDFLRGVWNSIFKLYLLKCSDARRVTYLRKLGMKIGERCRIRTMKFSTEPYLIEIGDHVAIAAGTEFITHDGANWVFEDDVDGGGVFGKIVIGNNVFIGITALFYPTLQLEIIVSWEQGVLYGVNFMKIRFLQVIRPRSYQKPVYRGCLQNKAPIC